MLRRRTAQGAFAIALLLASSGGCMPGDTTPTTLPTNDETDGGPTSTTMPRPLDELTTTPTPTAAMSRPDQAGAEAAARYFVQLYDYIFATRDLAPWEEMSADTCEFCTDVAADVREIAAGNVLVQAGPSEVTTLRAWEISEDKWFGADMVIEQPATDQFDQSGELVSSGAGGSVRLALAMTWADGWSVDAVDVLEPDSTPKW